MNSGFKTMMKWTLVLLAFFPLVYSHAVLVPYVSEKTFFLRGLVFFVSLIFFGLYCFDSLFRQEIIQKISVLWKHHLVKAIVVSYGFLAISTVFAFDRYLAFFGTVERGEGFISLTFFYAVFFLTTLLFEKKEWQYFAYGTLLSGWVLFVFELAQFQRGITRPGSFVDNPIFLASYYLFVICFALFVLKNGISVKKWWLVFCGILTSLMAIIGIFITGSRGVILGLCLGCVAVLVYFFAYGKKYFLFKSLSVRKASGITLIIFVLLLAVFVGTKHSRFWVSVPGFNRLTQVSLTDTTTSSRLINTQITLRAVNPRVAGAQRTLFGWGWDNYVFAWQAYYDPSIYQYDQGIFDRAHNFLLDRLVMTGILGLLSFLAVWYFFFAAIIRIGRRSMATGAIMLLFAVSFFVQNVSAFDSIITHLAFLVLLAFVLFESERRENEVSHV